MLWREVLSRLAPRAREFYVKSFEDYADAAFAKSQIDTPLRVAHFLAQVLHESGGLSRCEENLNYTSAERLHRVFPSKFPAVESAAPFVGQPEKLANKVYSNRLGNEGHGDGWKYRGRGMIQITGRANYALIGQMLRDDLTSNPEKVNTAEWAVDVACAFWTLAKCNAAADQDDILAVTKRVNGGQHGLNDRIRWLAMVKRELGVPE
jgi:putative chitinase